jgi:XTP/dITP diphosphohydrolase
MRGRVSEPKHVFYLSKNRHKFDEAKALLGERVRLVFRRTAFIEPQTLSIKEAALFKARQAAERFGFPFLVEDSGLFIRTLNGFPGALSSLVYMTIGIEGLLRLMRGVSAREAYFEACVVYGECGKPVRAFTGRVEGIISEKARGNRGFGFDPIFIPKSSRLTFAEMSLEQKNAHSHRARALRRFLDWLGERESL